MKINSSFIKNTFSFLFLFYVLYPGISLGVGTDKGRVTLVLNGIIDQTESQNASSYVSGVLTGTTSFSVTPIYMHYLPSGTTSWKYNLPLIGLTENTNECDNTAGSIMVLEKIPLTNKHGLQLQRSDNTYPGVYVIPEILFSISLTDYGDTGLKPAYSGQILNPPTDGLVAINKYKNNCFLPSMTGAPPIGGTKQITLTSPSTIPVYVRNDLEPGVLEYRGRSFFILTAGGFAPAFAYLNFYIQSNLMVVRNCEISNVTNTQMNVIFSNNYESFNESQLSAKCRGTKTQPFWIRVKVKEGQADSLEPTKLILDQISGSPSIARPWILGLPTTSLASFNLSCQDTKREGLMRFDGVDTQVYAAYANSSQITEMKIKWALCSSPEVKTGDYRGKIEVSFYVKS